MLFMGCWNFVSYDSDQRELWKCRLGSFLKMILKKVTFYLNWRINKQNMEYWTVHKISVLAEHTNIYK